MTGLKVSEDKHRCPPDVIGDLFRTTVTIPTRGEIHPAEMFLECCPSLQVEWDQWAEARLSCDHGTFVGVACILNITEAIRNAIQAFNGHQHTAYCVTSSCSQFDGHDGPCLALTDTELSVRRAQVLGKARS